MALDAQAPGFAADLDALDATTFRTCDTVQVYYVRSGQTDAASVLANGVRRGGGEFRGVAFLGPVGGVSSSWDLSLMMSDLADSVLG